MTETEKKILSELSAQQDLTQGWYKVDGVVYYYDGKELTSTNSSIYPFTLLLGAEDYTGEFKV